MPKWKAVLEFPGDIEESWPALGHYEKLGAAERLVWSAWQAPLNELCLRMPDGAWVRLDNRHQQIPMNRPALVRITVSRNGRYLDLLRETTFLEALAVAVDTWMDMKGGRR